MSKSHTKKLEERRKAKEKAGHKTAGYGLPKARTNGNFVRRK